MKFVISFEAETEKANVVVGSDEYREAEVEWGKLIAYFRDADLAEGKFTFFSEKLTDLDTGDEYTEYRAVVGGKAMMDAGNTLVLFTVTGDRVELQSLVKE